MSHDTGLVRIASSLAQEFDIIKTARPWFPHGVGYTMKGWDFTREEIATAISAHRMLNPAVEFGTNACPWNCEFCFAEDPSNPKGIKKRLDNEISFERRLKLVDELAALGARSVNYIGAGEPTIDPYFWPVIEALHARDITPIVYTEGSIHLTDPNFARRLYDLGATVVFKVNSLWNARYQNEIVQGPAGRKQPRHENYTAMRNMAIDTCMKAGFNQYDPTRLAFDTIVCKQNVDEIPRLHQWAREHNIFILIVNYLPSGRSSEPLHDALSRNDQFSLFNELARIDRQKFGLVHASTFPYAGGTPCTIRGMGLFVKISGEVRECPGTNEPVGDLRRETLADIWERMRHVTENFDGGCAPREEFWQKQKDPSRRPLSIEK